MKIAKMRQQLRFARRLALAAGLLAAAVMAVQSLASGESPSLGAPGHLAYNPAVFGEAAGPALTPTAQATASPTHAASTSTPTATATPTLSPTASATATATPTETLSPTATETPAATATTTPTRAPTRTPKPTRTPRATATATFTPTPTLTPPPGEELLVFDLNRPVTKDDHGFPWDKPPLANGDWTKPINFAEGTLYLRAEIFDQPVPQDMRLEFCVWQASNTRENCSNRATVSGAPGTVVTWSVPVQKMWKKDGLPINWSAARDRNGVAIRNRQGQPVSDFSGWAWSGENPDNWYPLNMRFTVVVVEKGAGFSGWEHYIP